MLLSKYDRCTQRRYTPLNSYLPDIRLILKLARSSTRVGEDRRAITVRVLVDNLNGVVERLGEQDHQYRSENLLGWGYN